MSHRIEKQWTTKAGLQAAILYVNDSHNCGYVLLDKDHPWYGSNIDDHQDIDVHGGITFSKEAYWIPIVSENIMDISPESKLWAIGFDAAHLGDKTAYIDYPEDTFKDVDYMTNECESLAKQIQDSI